LGCLANAADGRIQAGAVAACRQNADVFGHVSPFQLFVSGVQKCTFARPVNKNEPQSK
jgi:hypothetical protein